MKKDTENQETKFDYNEPNLVAPNHQFPKQQEFDFTMNIGIRARMLLEKAIQSLEGVNTSKLKELEITAKDLVTHRKEIKNALLAIIKEENGYDLRLRSGAIAYLGALKIDESSEIIVSIALDANENQFVRGYAVETLGRIKGRSIEPALAELINDPIFTVQEKAIRVLGRIGSEKNLASLKAIADKSKEEEIKFRANAAIHLLSNGKVLDRPERKMNKNLRKLVSEDGNKRSIGRQEGIKPQTTYGNHDLWGGLDFIANQELEKWKSEKPIIPVSYEIMDNLPKDITRIVLRGKDIDGNACCKSLGKLYRIHEDEMVMDLPVKNDLKLGCSLGIKLNDDRYSYQINNWLPEAPNSPVVYNITSEESTIWAKEKLNLKVNFHIPTSEKTALLRLYIKMPKDQWRELHINLSSDDLSKGEKTIDGFSAAIPGEIEIKAGLYAQNGGACKFNTKLMALPSNPISMNVSPTATSIVGAGPAFYNSSQNAFYCYAKMQVYNGFPHRVDVGSRVTEKVTDGGVEKDTFSFSIGRTTVPANSTCTINVSFSFGGNTYNVFKNFGDVTIKFTLQTSEGDISDSGIWAAMAQVKLALNFVGNFSFTTRSQLQSAVDYESNSIYQQRNFFISDSARFLLPSSNSDFGRYRDIKMDDNKDSDCTSGSDEADDLRDDYSSPKDRWLDVWLVETLSGPSCAASVGGFSPLNGPTGKGGSNSGVIIKMSAANLTTTFGRNLMGIIIAHEVGHFLGLKHDGDSSNFMAASTGGNNKGITQKQYKEMAKHGFVSRYVI